jgi:hypothetical protein
MPQHPEAIQRAQGQVAAALATRGVPARRAADIAESYEYHSNDTPEGPVLVFVPVEGGEKRSVFAHEFAKLADRIAVGIVEAERAPAEDAPADGAAPATPTRSEQLRATLRSSVAGFF